jgi:hypothetical protein
MIEQILKIEIERRKMFLEFVIKAFSGAEVEEIPIPQKDKPDGFEIAIRLKKPDSRSIIIRPRRSLMTDTDANFLQIFMDGIQTAREYLKNPPVREVDFQGTILLSHKGVEGFWKGEKGDPAYS